MERFFYRRSVVARAVRRTDFLPFDGVATGLGETRHVTFCGLDRFEGADDAALLPLDGSLLSAAVEGGVRFEGGRRFRDSCAGGTLKSIPKTSDKASAAIVFRGVARPVSLPMSAACWISSR
jgi:hypothetical protein